MTLPSRTTLLVCAVKVNVGQNSKYNKSRGKRLQTAAISAVHSTRKECVRIATTPRVGPKEHTTVHTRIVLTTPEECVKTAI